MERFTVDRLVAANMRLHPKEVQDEDSRGIVRRQDTAKRPCEVITQMHCDGGRDVFSGYRLYSCRYACGGSRVCVDEHS